MEDWSVGELDGCGPIPGGTPLGMFGIVGRGGIVGMAGVACVCGPMPGGSAGILGMVGIGWGAGSVTPTLDVGVGCGPMPGGKPLGGIGPAPNGAGIPGIPGMPGGLIVAASVAGFKCTKLWLLGNSSVSVPQLRSRMSTGFGQPARDGSELVAVISSRNEVGPTVYSKTLVWLP